MALIFISYSRKNEAFVLRLVDDLAQQRFPVWLDKRNISPGQRWDMAIENALNMATHIIFVMSAESVQSNNVRDEVDVGLDTGKTIIPILTEECDLPLRIRRLQYVDFRNNYEEGLKALVEYLPKDTNTYSPVPPAYSAPVSREVAPQNIIVSNTRARTKPQSRNRQPLIVFALLGSIAAFLLCAMVVVNGVLEFLGSRSPSTPSSNPSVKPITNTAPSQLGSYHGVVLGSNSEKVSNAKIVFDSEDGTIRKEVVSDFNGGYQISLPVGRYKVTATHPFYETYSTGSGFFVVTGANNQVGDISMKQAATASPSTVDVADAQDNATPDFRNLRVTYTSDDIEVVVKFSKPEDVEAAGNFVYLYGDQRDMIRFDKDSFELLRDKDADGAFETSLFKGSVDHPSTLSLAFKVSVLLMPDISRKRVWAYSMTSKDRIPDADGLQTH
ncbi:MAG: TIR domain-containing protein [Anaerolineaceae bacterium]|nr:TIR domain-containing protein [Anaerolineaceae bacterium]